MSSPDECRQEPGAAAEVPAIPAADLAAVRKDMSFAVEPGRFALVGFEAPVSPEDLAAVAIPPGQIVVEVCATTLLMRLERLPDVLARHPEARVEQGLVWIRFETPMGWGVVGFLALVTGVLARAGVPLGTVCGFQRDHLFISERYLSTTRNVLARLFRERV